MTGSQGSFLVGLIGISNTIARLLLGIASQKLNRYLVTPDIYEIYVRIIFFFLYRLFLYNTCLVVCGMAMALTNFFQPISAIMFGYDCTQFFSNQTSPALNSTAVFVSFVATNDTTALLSPPWACDVYVGQLIYASLYGVTSTAYVLLTTLVLADLLGAEKFTNAFGLLLLFQGVATFIGPPIVGTDSYMEHFIA